MKSKKCLQKKISLNGFEFYLVASEQGLKNAFWSKQKNIPLLGKLSDKSKEAIILEQAATELAEYLNGERKQFKVKLDLEGTTFQMKVWAELKKIPYGETRSYKQVANAVGTKAFRAVGSANGKNPVCVFIPCHRVIASDGTLGGYSGGLKNKYSLLKLESQSGTKHTG